MRAGEFAPDLCADVLTRVHEDVRAADTSAGGGVEDGAEAALEEVCVAAAARPGMRSAAVCAEAAAASPVTTVGHSAGAGLGDVLGALGGGGGGVRGSRRGPEGGGGGGVGVYPAAPDGGAIESTCSTASALLRMRFISARAASLFAMKTAPEWRQLGLGAAGGGGGAAARPGRPRRRVAGGAGGGRRPTSSRAVLVRDAGPAGGAAGGRGAVHHMAMATVLGLKPLALAAAINTSAVLFRSGGAPRAPPRSPPPSCAARRRARGADPRRECTASSTRWWARRTRFRQAADGSEFSAEEVETLLDVGPLRLKVPGSVKFGGSLVPRLTSQNRARHSAPGQLPGADTARTNHDVFSTHISRWPGTARALRHEVALPRAPAGSRVSSAVQCSVAARSAAEPGVLAEAVRANSSSSADVPGGAARARGARGALASVSVWFGLTMCGPRRGRPAAAGPHGLLYLVRGQVATIRKRSGGSHEHLALAR